MWLSDIIAWYLKLLRYIKMLKIQMKSSVPSMLMEIKYLNKLLHLASMKSFIESNDS